MSGVVFAAGAGASGASGDEGFGAFARLNDGFLGTGYSTAVELSLFTLLLILAYVAFSTARYLLSETGLGESVAEILGLRDK